MKRARTELIIALFLGILSGIIRWIDKEFSIEWLNYVPVTTVTFILAFILWMDSVKNRFYHKNIRRLIYIAGSLMSLWMIIRYIKYDIVDDVNVIRILWYIFYIPMILLPVMVFYAILYIGRLEKSSLSRNWFLLVLPGVLVVLGVLTNDFHHLAFSFPKGNLYANDIYNYEIIYYLAMIIMGLYIVMVLIQVFRKFLKNNKQLIIIPTLISLLALYYCITYSQSWEIRPLIGKMYALPDFICIFLILFWESAIAGVYGIRKQLAVNLEPQLGKLEKLLKSVSVKDEDFDLIMKLAAILNVYIKRKSNMLLLSLEQNEIKGEELELAFAESLEYLNLMDISEHMEYDLRLPLRSDLALFLFGLYEDALEAAILDGKLNALYLSVGKTDGKLIYYMEIGLPKELLPANYKKRDVMAFDGNLAVDYDEECEFIKYEMPLKNALSNKDSEAKNKSFNKLLNTRQIIHDDTGKALLSLRAYLSDPNASGNEKARQELLEIWLEEVDIFKNENVRENADVMDKVTDAANAVGISLQIEGDFPKDEDYKKLIAQAARECITNTFKHANGSILYIKSKKTNVRYTIEFTNDGEPPTQIVTETGGLKSLRESAELLGVKMDIKWNPRFVLMFTIDRLKG
ncbi:MAG: ATP-binding protein [Lachnospiraceae bacterium]|nr:ATP-binding protein [Lachnospiraceae bacterium]